MKQSPIESIAVQLEQAVATIELHLNSPIRSIHLYGSALQGGLKPLSDIDLLVTVDMPLTGIERNNLQTALLGCSAYPGTDEKLRALEVTVVLYSDLVPRRHPAKRQMQFGEWLRQDIVDGKIEPTIADNDLTILIAQLHQASLVIKGEEAESLFPKIPLADLRAAMFESLDSLDSSQGWVGNERNTLLTLCRIWYSVATGEIVSKDQAAEWLLERLPEKYKPIIVEARQSYLGSQADNLASSLEQVEQFIAFARHSIVSLSCTYPQTTK